VIRIMGAYRSGAVLPGTCDERLLGSTSTVEASAEIARCLAEVTGSSRDFVRISVVDQTQAERSRLTELFGLDLRPALPGVQEVGVALTSSQPGQVALITPVASSTKITAARARR